MPLHLHPDRQAELSAGAGGEDQGAVHLPRRETLREPGGHHHQSESQINVQYTYAQIHYLDISLIIFITNQPNHLVYHPFFNLNPPVISFKAQFSQE